MRKQCYWERWFVRDFYMDVLVVFLLAIMVRCSKLTWWEERNQMNCKGQVFDKTTWKLDKFSQCYSCPVPCMHAIHIPSDYSEVLQEEAACKQPVPLWWILQKEGSSIQGKTPPFLLHKYKSKEKDNKRVFLWANIWRRTRAGIHASPQDIEILLRVQPLRHTAK